MSGRKPGTYSQARRVLSTVRLLRVSRYGWTVEGLAEEHEVSTRQVRRDLALIEDEGLALVRTLDEGRVRVRLDRGDDRCRE